MNTRVGNRRPVDKILQTVSNRTAVLLLREVFRGETRFDQLRKRAGVTAGVASERLRELVAAGVLEKRPYREAGQRTRHEYVLTSEGYGLIPAVLGLFQWCAAHASAGHDVDESDPLATGTDRSLS